MAIARDEEDMEWDEDENGDPPGAFYGVQHWVSCFLNMIQSR